MYTASLVNSLIRNPKSIPWLLLWLILVGLALAWRAQNLDAFGHSNDEGAHLMWARLAVDGYPLYGETQAVQSPLFLEVVGLAFRLVGQTIQAGRWAMLMGFVLLTVTLSWLAYRAGGWLSALAAMFLLGILQRPGSVFLDLLSSLFFWLLHDTKQISDTAISDISAEIMCLFRPMVNFYNLSIRSVHPLLYQQDDLILDILSSIEKCT